MEEESQTIGGFGRSDYFQYKQNFAGTGEIRNRVFVEIGTASGKEPTEMIKLHSYIGQFLQNKGISLDTEDESSFEMPLLHFRRTFVEKMFAIHAKVEFFKSTGIRIGSYARHYYDLYCLSERPEVLKMLRSIEYQEIKTDYDIVSRKYFNKHYIPPKDMNFKKSDALFPASSLSQSLSSEYEEQCKILCFGEFPSWDQVTNRFKELQDIL